MIEIKKLPLDRWKDYRNLRLESLRSDPLAFGSSYVEEKDLAEDEWRRRTNNVIFALLNDKPVGMIGYIAKNKIKTRHIATIFGTYVERECRGKGIGDKLMESVMKTIQENVNISKIQLTVNPKQEAAVKLYEKHGFKLVGRLERGLKINDKFYDELMMERHL
jgi:ribosomal protein S18 acetylase RimI-like enzyme